MNRTSAGVKGRWQWQGTGWWRLAVLSVVALGTALPPAWGGPQRASAAPLRAAPELQRVGGAFVSPVFVTHAGDGSGRLFVVKWAGRVQVMLNGQTQATPFLDIANRNSSSGSEMGLLGLAFHPNYVANGVLYVYYTATNGDNTLARVHRAAGDPSQGDPASLQVLFAIPDPYPNHNGGMVTFGPDGCLDVGIGNGGDGDADTNADSYGDARRDGDTVADARSRRHKHSYSDDRGHHGDNDAAGCANGDVRRRGGAEPGPERSIPQRGDRLGQ